ncbi:MAG: hypothetical protein RL011_1662 [Pseudomonadota bacterium]
MRTKSLNRRQILRGLVSGTAVTMGLPLLEAMLNVNGTALADGGSPLPKRFGLWFWGVGAMPNHWRLTQTGRGWTPSAGLAPLQSVRDYVSVISNTRHPQVPVVHYGGQAYLLTGRYNRNGSDQQTNAYGSPGGPSVDQIVAKSWKGRTPIDSVVVGVSGAYQGSCCSILPTQASWLDNNVPNYHEFSLTAFYNKLFGASEANRHEALRRRSILDAVGGDLKSLHRRVGKADRIRLESHSQSVRDIELGIDKFAANQCTPPAAPTDLPLEPTKEPLSERNRLFADMIAVALSCDLTRVFTVQFTGRENDTIFWQVGATQGTHTLSHNGDAASIAKLNEAFTYTMGEFAYLLEKLKNTQDGTSNLLDSSCIYATSCIGNPVSHSYDRELLMMIAGGARGALNPGIHYRAGTEFSSAVALTALRAVDVGIPSFGSDGMESTQPLRQLVNI